MYKTVLELGKSTLRSDLDSSGDWVGFPPNADVCWDRKQTDVQVWEGYAFLMVAYS